MEYLKAILRVGHVYSIQGSLFKKVADRRAVVNPADFAGNEVIDGVRDVVDSPNSELDTKELDHHTLIEIVHHNDGKRFLTSMPHLDLAGDLVTVSCCSLVRLEAEKNSAIEHYKAWIRSDQQDHHPDEFL